MSDTFSVRLIKLYNVIISNLDAVVLVSGQIVTVGNEMADIFTGFPIKLTVTTFSRHFVQIFSIDDPHNQIEKTNATIHQSLIEFEKLKSSVEIQSNSKIS